MRSIFLGVLLIASSFQLLAQEETNASSSKWQARLRVLTVMPDESATIDVIGGDVDISTTVVPELDFTYFFTENIAAELILGTTKHKVKAINTAAGDIDLGSVWLLPPTLTAQYHFTGGAFKPYLGAGVNYTFFYGIDEGDADDLEYENSVGFAVQGGFDYALNDKWFLNLDVKKLFLSTDVTVNGAVGADVTIDPWLIGAGVGMKF